MSAALLVATETFHPNAIGHQLIYEYIHNHQNGTSLLDDGCDGTVIICPSALGAHEPPVPAEFGTVKSLKTEVASIILRQSGDGTYTEPGIGGVVERGARVHVRPMALESAGLVAGAKVTLHSDPVMLGGVLVQNGSIASTELQIPEYASIGFHTISLDIALADGGSLKYVQPIFITGPADDIDGDGVANKVDTCEFLAPSGTDLDSDGIDDVCDILRHEQAGPIGDSQYSTRATTAQPPALTAGSASIFHKPYTPNHTALDIVPHAAATVALLDANNHMGESDNHLLLITVSVLAFLLTVYLLLHNR